METRLFLHLFIFSFFVILISLFFYAIALRKNNIAESKLGIIWSLWPAYYNRFCLSGFLGWFVYLLGGSLCVLLLYLGRVKEVIPILIFWSYGSFTTLPLQIVFGEKGVQVEGNLIFWSEIDAWLMSKNADQYNVRLRLKKNLGVVSIPIPYSESERIKLLLARNIRTVKK